jgi:esterase/lipase superfamily enzyme
MNVTSIKTHYSDAYLKVVNTFREKVAAVKLTAGNNVIVRFPVEDGAEITLIGLVNFVHDYNNSFTATFYREGLAEITQTFGIYNPMPEFQKI